MPLVPDSLTEPYQPPSLQGKFLYNKDEYSPLNKALYTSKLDIPLKVSLKAVRTEYRVRG